MASGDFCDIEYAWDANKESPAKKFLEQAGADLNREKDVSPLARFVDLCQSLADTGTPPSGENYETCIQYLEFGIWELKRSNMRVSFYDLTTEGTCNHKEPVRVRERIQWNWIPYFDEIIRLGHSFYKESQCTSAHDLRETKRIRLEDTNHG